MDRRGDRDRRPVSLSSDEMSHYDAVPCPTEISSAAHSSSYALEQPDDRESEFEEPSPVVHRPAAGTSHGWSDPDGAHVSRADRGR